MPIDDYVGLPFSEAQEARFQDAKDYLEQRDFYHALDLMQYMARCATAVEQPLPRGFRDVTLQLYRLGIDVRMAEAQESLRTGNLEDAQEKLGLVAHYARGLRIQVPPEAASLKRQLFDAAKKAALAKIDK